MTENDRSDFEKCSEMSRYLCGLVLRAHEMLSEGEVDGLPEEIALASTDLLWLAKGKELPEEYFGVGHRREAKEAEKGGWKLV